MNLKRMFLGHLIFLVILPLTLSCLSTEGYFQSSQIKHPQFTTTSIILIIRDLAPAEIEKRFGAPDHTAIEMWGTDTAKPWRALVYEYSMGKHPDGKFGAYVNNKNTFAFDAEHNLLLYWDIQLAYKTESRYAQDQNEKMEIIFYNGVFIGDTQRGIPNGFGSFKFNIGNTYIGEFNLGKMTGQGKLYFVNGDAYEGSFINGRPAEGFLVKPNGDKYKCYLDEKGVWQFNK